MAEENYLLSHEAFMAVTVFASSASAVSVRVRDHHWELNLDPVVVCL